MAALSRESPFKNLDKERSRPAQPISVGNQSTNEMMETARSPVAGPRLHNKGGYIAFRSLYSFIYLFILNLCYYVNFFSFPSLLWRWVLVTLIRYIVLWVLFFPLLRLLIPSWG